MSLKLAVEFVPKPLWGSNLWSLVPESEWTRIRKQVYRAANHRCEICGVHPDRLECHEVWRYDDVNFIQKLSRLIALCPLCHGVKHFARSRIYGTKEDVEELARHFMMINACNANTLASHYDSGMDKWRERSAHDQWSVDWGEYSALVKV